ncbi:MAG: ferrochelatase [Cyclobacteriaceae bacterium]
MANSKTGVLLVNLGTPDSTSVNDVRKYLREFLMDKRVIDIPFLNRWLLVNLIIAPFRAPKSAREYERLWTDRGSPLKYYGLDVKELLQNQLGNDFIVAFGMRYQNPSLQSALDSLNDANVERIIVIPMFPQYASASTGSVADKVMEIAQNWEVIPSIDFINTFASEDSFIDAWVEVAKKYLEKDYDHYVFSYHGLPERQIKKASVDGYCKLGSCCDTYHKKNHYCYRAQCFLTTRLLCEKLNIPLEKTTTCFQSRLGKNPWVQPYTDHVLEELPKNGIKKVLAFSPAFVADCLETTVEVGETYKEDFIAAGGEEWDLVESLNVHPKWIDCLENLVKKNSRL